MPSPNQKTKIKNTHTHILRIFLSPKSQKASIGKHYEEVSMIICTSTRNFDYLLLCCSKIGSAFKSMH